MHILSPDQENVISIFMNMYGTDAGAEAIALFEKSGSLGLAIIKQRMNEKKRYAIKICAKYMEKKS